MLQKYVVGALVAYAASAIDLVNQVDHADDQNNLAQTDSTLESEQSRRVDANCCIIYDEQQYRGNSKKICEDATKEPWYQYDTSDLEVNSYVCGENAKMSTCKEYASKYDCEDSDQAVIASSSGAMAIGVFGYYLDYNDIYSFKVEYYDSDTMGAATLFSEIDCTGYTASFEFNPRYTMQGSGASEYRKSEMNKMGHYLQEKTSAIRVPNGYQVDLYSEDNFAGTKQNIQGPPYRNGVSPCTRVNSLPKSLRISKTAAQGVATGAWIRLLSDNDGIKNVNVKIGLSRSQETMDSTKNTSSDKISIALGFAYAGMSIKTEYSHEEQLEELAEAKQAVNQTTELEFQKSCYDVGNNGATIYQWTVTSANGMETVATGNTICRNDRDHRLKPGCSPSKCDDKYCTVCRN